MLVPDQIEILLCTEPIDMRRGADGLAGLVRDLLGDEPQSRKLFVFRASERILALLSGVKPSCRFRQFNCPLEYTVISAQSEGDSDPLQRLPTALGLS